MKREKVNKNEGQAAITKVTSFVNHKAKETIIKHHKTGTESKVEEEKKSENGEEEGEQEQEEMHSDDESEAVQVKTNEYIYVVTLKQYFFVKSKISDDEFECCNPQVPS